MFGTIRRHQTWLWGIIITLTIISFVIYFDPSERANRGRAARQSNKAPKINGKTINSGMIDEAIREVRFIYFLNNRRWPEQDPEQARQIDWDNEAVLRLFRFSKAEELGIEVSDEALSESYRRFFGGADISLERFEKEQLEGHGLKKEDVIRFLYHQTMDQQLISVVGAAGRMILPAEAEKLYREQHQETSGDIVFFNQSNYLAKVVITNGALTNFFAQRGGYRIPDKVRVGYIEFHKTNFMAEAEKEINAISNLSMRLQEHYYKTGGTNHYKDTNGVPLSEEKALAKIKEQEIEGRTFNLAARKANEVANRVYDMTSTNNQPLRAENLEAAAKEQGFAMQISMPFDKQEGPTNLDVTPRFVEEAFSLDLTNKPISFQPLPGENGIYLIALKDVIPGRAETFEEVKDKVGEDYKRLNAYMLARSEGTNFIATATNGMNQGKTFDEMVLQYNALHPTAGLKSEALPPISPATESVTNLDERVEIKLLKNVMQSIEPQHVSPYIDPRMMGAPGDAFVVHVRARLPFDEAKLREDLPKFTEEMRARKQNEIFGQWFRKQVEKETWLKDMLERSHKQKQQQQQQQQPQRRTS